MKNLFIGLIATGFMTLSSFTASPNSNVLKNEKLLTRCTISGNGITVTVTGAGDVCAKARAVYRMML